MTRPPIIGLGGTTGGFVGVPKSAVPVAGVVAGVAGVVAAEAGAVAAAAITGGGPSPPGGVDAGVEVATIFRVVS
jgi:hypothetical protein